MVNQGAVNINMNEVLRIVGMYKKDNRVSLCAKLISLVLLVYACERPGVFPICDGDTTFYMTVKKGQYLTGLTQLARLVGVKKDEARNAIDKLVGDGEIQIDEEVRRKFGVYLINIPDYDKKARPIGKGKVTCGPTVRVKGGSLNEVTTKDLEVYHLFQTREEAVWAAEE